MMRTSGCCPPPSSIPVALDPFFSELFSPSSSKSKEIHPRKGYRVPASLKFCLFPCSSHAFVFFPLGLISVVTIRFLTPPDGAWTACFCRVRPFSLERTPRFPFFPDSPLTPPPQRFALNVSPSADSRCNTSDFARNMTTVDSFFSTIITPRKASLPAFIVRRQFFSEWGFCLRISNVLLTVRLCSQDTVFSPIPRRFSSCGPTQPPPPPRMRNHFVIPALGISGVPLCLSPYSFVAFPPAGERPSR